MTALEAIKRFKTGDLAILKNEKWLLYLGLTDQHRVNPERLISMGEANENYVLQTVSQQLCLSS